MRFSTSRYRKVFVLSASALFFASAIGLNAGFGVPTDSSIQKIDSPLEAFNILKPGMSTEEVSKALWPANMVKRQDSVLTWTYILPDRLEYIYVTLIFKHNELEKAFVERSYMKEPNEELNKILRSLPYS